MPLRRVAATLAATLMAFSAQAADLSDLKILPDDGNIVIQLDVKALLGTGLVSDLVKC